MAYSMIIVAGNLSADPEMRYTPSGSAVTSFSIPVNRQYTARSGEVVKETTWHNIVVFGRSAEACNEYLKKGSIVLVEGQLVPDKATGGPKVYTKRDGSSGASFEIKARSVQFLFTNTAGQQESANLQVSDAEIPPEDDIPF